MGSCIKDSSSLSRSSGVFPRSFRRHIHTFLVSGKLAKVEVVLGEVHGRPGGDFIHYMTQYVTDIELYGVVFDQMLGRPVDMTKYQPRRGGGYRFLNSTGRPDFCD
jgi:hypothetical protein